MKIKSLTFDDKDFPEVLRDIPQPPKQLYVLGGNLSELLNCPRLAVVGSRKVSAYGRAVTDKLVRETAARGVVIISGLAIGVDGLAHKACLAVGSPTIAVLPCGIDRVYPSQHHQLAKEIVAKGGVLISEYPNDSVLHRGCFIERNRLVSGLSDAVLITEAAARSGTLSTANFALDQGREVLAVPGNITSLSNEGTNNLIKSGATPVTRAQDILNALSIAADMPEIELIAKTPAEHTLLTLLQRGVSDIAELQLGSRLDPAIFNQTLTMLEISGHIRHRGGGHWSLS